MPGKPCSSGHFKCGSKYAPCCLLCPLPTCKDEQRPHEKDARAEGMAALYYDGGLTLSEVGSRYGMTGNGVYKALTRLSLRRRERA